MVMYHHHSVVDNSGYEKPAIINGTCLPTTPGAEMLM